jgi:hypothetical protein
VVGHHAGWGLIGSREIEPYQVTPGSIDTMNVRVREKIDVHGVGTDVVDMRGIFVVRRDDPCAVDGEVAWGRSCVKTEFRSLELVGQSQTFGTVRVHLDPRHASHGEVGPAEDGSLGADCLAHCFPVVELPELGLRMHTAGRPVTLASKVIQIPPVGDVARSTNSAFLYDDQENRVGEIVSSDIEVGEVIASFPLGRTRPHGAPPHEHHAGQGHPDPSGPGFYAEPPSEPLDTTRPEAPAGGDVLSERLGAILSRLESDLTALAQALRAQQAGAAAGGTYEGHAHG